MTEAALVANNYSENPEGTLKIYHLYKDVDEDKEETTTLQLVDICDNKSIVIKHWQDGIEYTRSIDLQEYFDYYHPYEEDG